MFSVQLDSQGAGQTRPVNSGKLLVECSVSSALRQIVPVRDQVVDRTAIVTKRNPAIHAACRLAAHFREGQRMDEFLIVF